MFNLQIDYASIIIYNLKKGKRKMLNTKKNILMLFLDKLLAFPLWIKLVIFVNLRKNLSTLLSEEFLNIENEDIYQLYIPTLTFNGKTELTERKNSYEENFYSFLKGVSEGLTILEIAMNNFWTMEEISKYFTTALDENFIKTPESIKIIALSGFISGKLRTGEYYKRIGKINIDQLEQILIKQREYASSGIQHMIAKIMVELNLINKSDVDSLLILKFESKKRFFLDSNIIPKEVNVDALNPVMDEKKYKEEIAKLTEQNKLLKEKLNKILPYIKKS